VVVLSDHGFQAVTLPHKPLTGHHQTQGAIDGLLFARGPGIPAGTSTAGTSIYDLLPTVLAWMGLPVADDMVGAPAAFLPNARLQRIASYEGRPIDRLEAGPSGQEGEILEGLRALGYVEPEAEP
jgi:arylsulfatase A-like enzyme